jgi:hypothetical protein
MLEGSGVSTAGLLKPLDWPLSSSVCDRERPMRWQRLNTALPRMSFDM